MVARSRWPYTTPEEYLRREKDAETKSEYIDGVIVAMAGASPEHIDIAFSLAMAIDEQVRAVGCHGYLNDMLVRAEAPNRYYYPDYVVWCGTPEFELKQGLKSLLNPILIVEVLSASTERQDRGEKRLAYVTIESLGTYVLVHQDQPLVELFLRNPKTFEWHVTEISGIDANLPLAAIGAELPLARIYRDVVFPETGDTVRLL